MKSKNDFAASLLATTDEDWENKWNTPPDTKPNFNKAGVVPYGKKVFVLSFYANPKPDYAGNVNVRCDLMITAPTGKVSLQQKDLACFSGRIAGSPYNLYLSAPVITFTGDLGDPPGTWTVQVTMRDDVRKVALPLKTTFQLR